ncbi:MAG: NADH-quinone oxidoreductase subunit N, partial [Candidatus Hydrothermarchaeota archaeon]
LLAAGSKKMGFIAAFRVIILALIAMKIDWYIAFAVIAVVTMTLGNLAALVQNSIRRMLAYSSIAHAGYIAMVFVVVAHSAKAAELAIVGGILHAFSHAFAKAGAFIVTAMITYIFASKIDSIDDYNGLGKRAPITALTMAILLCSLAGIPPTFGFYSKFVLFLSAIQGDLLWLAIIAVLNSAISVYYYARVIMRMYWGKPTGDKVKEPAPYALALIIATLGTLALGVYPSPVSDWAYAAAQSLIGGL